MLRKINKKVFGIVAIVGLNICGISQAVIVDDITLPPMKGKANSMTVPTEEKQATLNVNSIIAGNGAFSCVNSTLTSKSKMSGTLQLGVTRIDVSGVCFNPSPDSDKIEIIGTAGGSTIRLNGSLFSSGARATLNGTIRLNGKEYRLELAN